VELAVLEELEVLDLRVEMVASEELDLLVEMEASEELDLLVEMEASEELAVLVELEVLDLLVEMEVSEELEVLDLLVEMEASEELEVLVALEMEELREVVGHQEMEELMAAMPALFHRDHQLFRTAALLSAASLKDLVKVRVLVPSRESTQVRDRYRNHPIRVILAPDLLLAARQLETAATSSFVIFYKTITCMLW